MGYQDQYEHTKNILKILLFSFYESNKTNEENFSNSRNLVFLYSRK